MAGFVHEVDRQHGVRACRDSVRIAGRRVDLDALEGWTERPSQGLEPLGRTSLVVAEPEPEHAQPVLSTLGDGGGVTGIEPEGSSSAAGQRGPAVPVG